MGRHNLCLQKHLKDKCKLCQLCNFRVSFGSKSKMHYMCETYPIWVLEVWLTDYNQTGRSDLVRDTLFIGPREIYYQHCKFMIRIVNVTRQESSASFFDTRLVTRRTTGVCVFVTMTLSKINSKLVWQEYQSTDSWIPGVDYELVMFMYFIVRKYNKLSYCHQWQSKIN